MSRFVRTRVREPSPTRCEPDSLPAARSRDNVRLLAFDRFLARLQLVAPDLWLLKGGVALEYRLERARGTLDVDLSSNAGLDSMTAALRAATAADLEDYFTLSLVGEPELPSDEIETYRFRVDVFLDGKLFQPITVDVGFADPLIGEPQALTPPPLLAFAGISPATVRAIPIEQHLAEKIHAYTRSYAGRRSTRVKDLVDMALLIAIAPLNPATMSPALRQTFQVRATHELPAVIPPPPKNWAQPYRELAKGLPVPTTADAAHRLVADALAPSLTSARQTTG